MIDYARGYFTQLSEFSHESQGPFTKQILDDIAAQYHRRIEAKQLPGQGLLESRLSLINEPFEVIEVEALPQGDAANLAEFYRNYCVQNLGRKLTPEEKDAIDKSCEALGREINPAGLPYRALRTRIMTRSGARFFDSLWIDKGGYRVIVN